MKNVRRKMVLAAIMIIFTIVALGTSTYAWFTLNNTAKVEQIEMTVSAGAGIELSLTGKDPGYNWKSELTFSDIKNMSTFKFEKFDAVTTEDGKAMTYRNNSTAATTDYIEFDLWFKVDNISFAENETGGIFLYDYNNPGGTYIESDGKSWTPDVEFTYDDGDVRSPSTSAKTYYAKDAIRLSFAYDESSKVFDLSQDSTNPSRGYGYQYGAIDYYNKKTGESISAATTGPEVVYKNQLTRIDGNDNVESTSDTKSLVCNLTAEAGSLVGKTTIRIWLEGWDADCFNAIYSDKITAQLKFKFGKYNNN